MRWRRGRQESLEEQYWNYIIAQNIIIFSQPAPQMTIRYFTIKWQFHVEIDPCSNDDNLAESRRVDRVWFLWDKCRCCTFSFSFAQNGQKNGTNKILGATYGVCTFWIPVDLQCKYLYLEMLFGQAAAHWSDWQTNNLWLCLANDIKMIIDKIRNLSAVAVVAATLQVKYAEMNAINLLVMRNLMILISLNRLANARWIR